MNTPFSRVAIVNRGEPAMRFIHAVREYNIENNCQIEIIALFTEPDRHSQFVKSADESICLGPATYFDEKEKEVKSTYLNYPRIREVLQSNGVDAVWPGWGFVAERADFVDMCDEIGVTFIGPGAQVMRELGDKIRSKMVAENAGVPVIPWSGGPVETLASANQIAAAIGYPLMLKATAGGGGRGIRKITNERELAIAFDRARSESHKAFGDPTVFLEKMISPARHVEVQIIGDKHGMVWALGVRDCTLQRKHQKVLEETPSPALSAAVQKELCEAAARLGKAMNYYNAGTVEFLYDIENKQFAFMELNARLQVEHPVTEMVSGVDMVKLQLHVALGGKLNGKPPKPRGHAIEVRLNAENPQKNFAPAPGKIERFQIPVGPGIRVDTGFSEGDEIPPDFDSMIAKIIAVGEDRSEALARLRRALMQSSVIVRNGMSNKGFLLGLLNHPDVVSSKVDTGWLEQMMERREHISRKYAEIALLQAAVEVSLAEMELARARFFNSAHRGRPEAQEKNGITVRLVYHGEPYKLVVHRLGREDFRVDVDGQQIHLQSAPVGHREWRLEIAGSTHRIISLTEGQPFQVSVNGNMHQVHLDQGGIVRSPAPAVVVTTEVAEGEYVKKGDTLAILEAMKMEMSIAAEFAGVVKKVLVRNNQQVFNGAPLMVIEPEKTGEDSDIVFDRIPFAGVVAPLPDPEDARAHCRRNSLAIRRILKGFDAGPQDLKQIIDDQTAYCWKMAPDDPELLELEKEILHIFTDIISLFRREPSTTDFAKGMRFSSEEYFFTYLQNTRAEDEGLPRSFIQKLKQALGHYNVTSLDPSTALDISLFRIFISHQRMERQLGPIIGILERRLQNADKLAPVLNDEFRGLLNRMIIETQRRYPVINDLARRVHYRFYDQPLLNKVRQETLARMISHLDKLAEDASRPERYTIIDDLVACPQPIRPLLSNRFMKASPELQRIILEVITRRYYRIRRLKHIHFQTVGETNICRAEYDFKDIRTQIYATHTNYDNLTSVIEGLNRMIASLPEGQDAVFDLYLWHGDVDKSRDFAAEIIPLLNATKFEHYIRRIVVSISGPDMMQGDSGVNIFTFRQNENGFYEEKVIRGMHPLVAARLEFWRLRNFDIERLPSVEDVFLFKAVANEDPKDQRLFAFAEVRDLTHFRDPNGQLQLPNLELMLHETISAIRELYTPELNWNRIVLYIWPPFIIQQEQLRSIMNRLAPVTDGVGLEKVTLRARMPNWSSGSPPEEVNGQLQDTVMEFSRPAGRELLMRIRKPEYRPIRVQTEYDKKVVRLRRRGLVYPYELIKMITIGKNDRYENIPPGEFVEYDLDENNLLVPVYRPYGQNSANIVVGVIRNFTDKYPEGMTRVALFGDPIKAMGSLAEPECRRINAGLALAQEMNVPLEWYACSAGAKIAMDSGTENMDWISLVLRRIVEFTQAGGEINIIVNGINVGAQPYWNAEATMLMHTRGILIMMPESAMVLTGKQALEYSGGVAAEDNQGIGGYERIMGPNGQAQYFAEDIGEACQILFRYYDHSYVKPGERFPRKAPRIDDAVDRNVCEFPYTGEFATVGEIFSDETNPGRKSPFDIRQVMQATIDQDFKPLERWFSMQDAEIAVIWDAHVGGIPVCMIGIESQPIPRLGFAPADGPQFWTSGTLFPRSSKKIARAVNASSGNRPLVVLANLSGFDGSPDSLRNWQLEFGAEIGRAIVNFRGPVVFCVISRYHGGAFVVFSNKLNDNMEVVALEGTYASVIGGAPAAAVVFAREVAGRTAADARLKTLEAQIATATGSEKVTKRAEYNVLYQEIYSEKLGEVAREFDAVHSVQRAQQVGSVDIIIPPQQLRPYIVASLEKGMKRELQRWENAAVQGK